MKEFIIRVIDPEEIEWYEEEPETPELIRCKDCIWFRSGLDIDGKPFATCRNTKHIRVYGGTEPDFYCGYAERKDGEMNVSGSDCSNSEISK